MMNAASFAPSMAPLYMPWSWAGISEANTARGSPVTPIETPFDEQLPGKTADDVLEIVVETISGFKYVDPILSFNALRELYRDE